MAGAEVWQRAKEMTRDIGPTYIAHPAGHAAGEYQKDLGWKCRGRKSPKSSKHLPSCIPEDVQSSRLPLRKLQGPPRTSSRINKQVLSIEAEEGAFGPPPRTGSKGIVVMDDGHELNRQWSGSTANLSYKSSKLPPQIVVTNDEPEQKPSPKGLAAPGAVVMHEEPALSASPPSASPADSTPPAVCPPPATVFPLAVAPAVQAAPEVTAAKPTTPRAPGVAGQRRPEQPRPVSPGGRDRSTSDWARLSMISVATTAPTSSTRLVAAVEPVAEPTFFRKSPTSSARSAPTSSTRSAVAAIELDSPRRLARLAVPPRQACAAQPFVGPEVRTTASRSATLLQGAVRQTGPRLQPDSAEVPGVQETGPRLAVASSRGPRDLSGPRLPVRLAPHTVQVSPSPVSWSPSPQLAYAPASARLAPPQRATLGGTPKSFGRLPLTPARAAVDPASISARWSASPSR